MVGDPIDEPLARPDLQREVSVSEWLNADV